MLNSVAYEILHNCDFLPTFHSLAGQTQFKRGKGYGNPFFVEVGLACETVQLLAHYQISHRACEVFAQPSDWIHTACKSQRSTNNKLSCSQSVEHPRRLTIGAVGSPFMNNTRGLSFISCVRIWVRIRQRWSSEKFVMWSPAYQKLKIQSVHVLTLWKCSFVYFWAPSLAL